MSTVPANVTTTGRRPFGVSLLSILIMLGGVFDVIGGVLLLFERKDREGWSTSTSRRTRSPATRSGRSSWASSPS